MQPNPYPVRLAPPDISPYRVGNRGVDYVTTFDSGRPGPHVMVSAVVHGNELSGALALDFLFQSGIRPLIGKLTLGFLNVGAFLTFDSEEPEASRFIDEDFNRVWDVEVLDGARSSAELRRAREIRPIIDEIDYLLDLHSMQHPTVPLMLCGPTEKGRKLARGLGYPSHVMSDEGHAAGRRLRDYGAFGDETSPKNALLIECGQHWDPASVDVAKEATIRFLAHFGTIAPEAAAAQIDGAPVPPQTVVEVTDAITIATEDFRFAADYIGMEIIEQAETVIAWDGEQPISTPYDRCVLIMPSRRLTVGQTAVRLGRIVP